MPGAGETVQRDWDTADPLRLRRSTKLLVPRVRSHVLRRDRLIAQIEAGLHGCLTLLSAPAGFGKTTLLVDALSVRASETGSARVVAWVSLDDGDNDPVQFLHLVLAGLRAAVPNLGESALAVIHHPVADPLRASLATLIPELSTARDEIVLVLEDYHAIRSVSIHGALDFLLDHLPERVHVVIATREDPPLSLHRLRARGDVRELRAADLRLTPQEGVLFISEVMELKISAEEAAALDAYSEGWVAGLQLAALSIRDAGVAALLAGQRENRAYIFDYLGAEVLAHLSRPMQTFLLRTSVLRELSAASCAAVLGDTAAPEDAQEMLERVERANLFLAPLDDERRWFRYHHLFAEFLQLRLAQTEPGVTQELHRRASAWYDGEGRTHEAIRHALAASDYDRAARLIEREDALSFSLRGRLQTVLGWYRALPPAMIRSSPELGVGYAFVLWQSNLLEAAESHLQRAEQALGATLAPEELRSVRGRVALLRTLMIGTGGDFTRGIGLARQALDLLPASDTAARSMAELYAATLEFRATGDVSAWEGPMAAAVERVRAAGPPVMTRVGLGWLARLHMFAGNLSRAAAVGRELSQVLPLSIATPLPAYYFILGDLQREWNDLAGAEQLLAQGIELVTNVRMVGSHATTLGYIALARVRQARGDLQGAMDALDSVATMARQRGFAAPMMAEIEAARARLWLQLGQLAAAVRWADRSGLGPSDALSFPRESEYYVFARVLIAKRDPVVLGLLERLLGQAETCGRMGSAIEILALDAMALKTFGEPAAALAALERALTLAAPEGYVRTFVDEGAPMATLLRQARRRGIAPEYSEKLIRAFHSVPANRDSWGSERSSGSAPPVRAAPQLRLLEPLTRREQQILRLIGTGASNQTIARTLFVTIGTVKTHVQHIMAKLDAQNRTEAVAKAKELDLD